MDIITINVSAKETVDLQCVRCGNSRRISTALLQADANTYKVQCKCGFNYYVAFDRRRFPRRKTELKGVYFLENSLKDEIIDIIDLSKTGLCFIAKSNIDIKIGQIIALNFILDNPERDNVECKATIRQINDCKVGVEFLNLSSSVQRVLAFYLFNYVEK